MRLPYVGRVPRWRLRRARFSVGLQLTLLFGGLFLLSGAALIAITYLLFERATAYRTPRLPHVPRVPRLAPTLFNPQLPAATSRSPLGPKGLALQPLQHQVAELYNRLTTPGRPALPGHQLTQVRHQLAQVRHQLALAVHQMAHLGSIEAVQRGADAHQLLVDSGIALALVAVFALVAGWLVAHRILRPIRTMTRTAQRISSSNLHERLALHGPKDELKELGDTLDDLLARLEAAFDAQRHFVANASHELRTPLTRERTLVQVALGDPSTPEVWRSTGEELLASNRQQEALIEALLTLASSESALDRREPVDLADICDAVLRRPGSERDCGALHVVTAIRPAVAEGDARLVERLVANLVDNATRHNVVGGSVHITTETADGHAVLTVTNSGPIIPPGEVARLFQPFQRLGPHRIHHRSGHGLGLSIVRAIATAHGATIAAEPERGGGLSVRVVFPQPANPQGLSGRASRSRSTGGAEYGRHAAGRR